MKMSLRYGLLFAIGNVLHAAQVPAQAPAPARAVVEGSIVDAETGAPLRDVLVTLDRAESDVATRQRVTRSDSGGVYVFSDVAPGSYSLQAERVGYHGQRIILNVRDASDPRVSIGLSIAPVALEPIRVAGVVDRSGDRTYARGDAGDGAGAPRLAAERARQRLFLPGDVRVLTYADVLEAVTLGESDLFRALQRLPGVSTLDEYSAELWMRGASFDALRIYVDDVPLFNPLHAAGAFGSVSTDAIGAAFLHPGAQPLSYAGGGAGTLDLRTRRGEADSLAAVGELSLVSARLAFDGASSDDRRAFMIAARRTYLDLLTSAVGRMLDIDDAAMPYDFLDVTARFDQRLSEDAGIEASALLQMDALRGDVADVLHDTRARWGNAMARVSVLTPVRGHASRHTAGISTFASRVRTVAAAREPGTNAPTASPSRNLLVHMTVRGELLPAEERSWRAGYELAHEVAEYQGRAPLLTLDPQRVEEDLEIGGSNTRAALWLERQWHRGTVTAEGGARVEAGTRALDSPPVRLAPRVALRWRPLDGTTLSAAAARSWQSEQAVAPAGVSPGLENFASELLWLVADRELPVVRSDIITVGAEHWLADRWLGGVTAWARRRSGVAHEDPTPGLDVGRSLFTIGDEAARGLDLSVRRLTGVWTASLGYSYTIARASSLGFEFPADGDQRHVLDLTGSRELGRGWIGRAAYTYATGAPYTRTFPGSSTCASGECIWLTPPFRGEPNGQRRTASSSLDLSLDWSRRMRGWTLGGFIQLRNALDADNAGRYNGYVPPHCPGSCDGVNEVLEGFDRFHPGLPRVPLIGLRIAF